MRGSAQRSEPASSPATIRPHLRKARRVAGELTSDAPMDTAPRIVRGGGNREGGRRDHHPFSLAAARARLVGHDELRRSGIRSRPTRLRVQLRHVQRATRETTTQSADFVDQDEGRFVVAAADGTVNATDDGYYDRQTDGVPGTPANYVSSSRTEGRQPLLLLSSQKMVGDGESRPGRS